MMLVSRYNPFAEVEKMHNQFERMFEEMTTTRMTNDWTPAVELQDKSNHFILRAIIPGLETYKLDIQATKKGIVFSGKTTRPQLNEAEKYLYSEFPVGEFRRVVALPEAIINTEVKADYTNGILTLTLPKAPEAVNRVVKVNLMETHQPEQLETAEV
ncbi:hsp20/alpha crystallin family protein [Lyngbya aestuarii BL J]|uniref:Hsp20/alpha crystallin family protein n=1 Tax=Lyngbya aestuarii BL J TaxID=1348334 RepID=U7QHS0_9CYAN|nr:Hsp20/alpha crystallin family protein [Lyngbya aestuarii]ERT07428.1 hsp20/alpha crystallin family protein [Lyngbya aestuarii BL J]